MDNPLVQSQTTYTRNLLLLPPHLQEYTGLKMLGLSFNFFVAWYSSGTVIELFYDYVGEGGLEYSAIPICLASSIFNGHALNDFMLRLIMQRQSDKSESLIDQKIEQAIKLVDKLSPSDFALLVIIPPPSGQAEEGPSRFTLASVRSSFMQDEAHQSCSLSRIIIPLIVLFSLSSYIGTACEAGDKVPDLLFVNFPQVKNIMVFSSTIVCNGSINLLYSFNFLNSFFSSLHKINFWVLGVSLFAALPNIKVLLDNPPFHALAECYPNVTTFNTTIFVDIDQEIRQNIGLNYTLTILFICCVFACNTALNYAGGRAFWKAGESVWEMYMCKFR